MTGADPLTFGWQLYVLGLVLSGAVVSVLGTFLWEFRDSRVAQSIIVILTGCALWSVTLVLQIVIAQFQLVQYPAFNALDALRYVGLYAIIFGLFFFALTFTGRQRYATRRIALVLSVLPLFVVTTVLTNHYHLLFWSQPPIPGPGGQPEWAVAFLFHTIAGYAILGVAIIMLLAFVFRSDRLYRAQVFLVLAAVVVPAIGNLSFLLVEQVSVDPTPIAFAASGVLLFGAVYRYQLATVTPVARQTIMANMNQGVLVIDDNNRITLANDEVRSLLGIDESVPIGDPIESFLPEQPAVHAAVEAALDAKHADTQEISLSDRHLSISVSQMANNRGKPIGQLLFVSDVTERKERQLELSAYTKLVQTVGDPMYVLDSSGHFQRVNDAFVEYANASRDEIVGSHATRFMRKQDYERGTALLEQLRNEEGRRWDTYEMEFTPVDGEPIPSETKITPVLDDDGRFTETVGVMRDITTRKHREEQLDLLRQVFSRVLRHNLRNDMTIIRGAAERIAGETDGVPNDQAEIILDRSERLLSVSQNARDLERVIAELDQTITVDLVPVTRHVVSDLRAEYDAADIEMNMDESARATSHKMVSTAIRNLIENAIVHNGDQPHVRVDVEVEPEAIVVRVTDDGPGIPGDEIEVLREEHESSLKHGSGVGLWLVNFVTEESDGELLFGRDDGETVVAMVLPAA